MTPTANEKTDEQNNALPVKYWHPSLRREHFFELVKLEAFSTHWNCYLTGGPRDADHRQRAAPQP